MPDQFSLFKRKITVFRKGLKDQDFDAVYSELTKIPPFSGGANTKLSLPQDAPEEIPRIILNSADNKVSCLVSPQKIQLEWLPDVSSDTTASSNLVSEILEKIEPRNINDISRVGNIAEYVRDVSDGQTFASSLKPGIIGNLQYELETFSFDLTLNDNIEIDGNNIKCNRFTKLFSTTRDSGQTQVIIAMIDFNTHPREQISWDIQNFKKFILQSENKLPCSDIVGEIFV